MNVRINVGCPELEVVINCPEKSDEVGRLAEALRNFDRKLSGMKSGQTYLIDKRDVLYFESVDKRCFLYTAGEALTACLLIFFPWHTNEAKLWLAVAGCFAAAVIALSILGELYFKATGKRYTAILGDYKAGFADKQTPLSV